MARLIFPKSFLAQRELFVKIFDKDAADGTGSAIRQYLTENGIDLDADKTAGNEADVQEAAQIDFSREAEHQTGLRDGRFDPVFENMKGGIKFLKKLFKRDPMKVGLWGVQITTTGKLLFPKEVLEKFEAFKRYYTKNNTWPTPPSPLVPYLTEKGIDIDADKAKADAALLNNSNAKEKAGRAENATQERDRLWLPVVADMTGIGQFLMGLYEDDQSKLIDWGFVVDDSPQAPKEITTKVKLLETVTINGAIIGGTFTNTGTVALNLYKGKTASGTAVVIPPNGLYGIAKGYSVITVVNLSNLVNGKFKVLRSK